MTDELADRLARVGARVQALEDELAITRTVVEYGFAVDSGDASATGALYTEHTVFDVDGGVMEGRDAVERMVTARGTRACCRIARTRSARSWSGPTGTLRVVVGYSRVYVHRGDDFELFRIGCNRWEMERGPSGWIIAKRTTRVLGSEESQAVLASGLREPPAG